MRLFFSEKSINFRILNPPNDVIRWIYPTVGMRRPLSHGIPLDRPAVALREPVHRADRALPAGEASCIDGQGFVHRGRYDLAACALRRCRDAPSHRCEPLRLRGASRRPRVAGAAHQAPVARQRVQRLPSDAVIGTLRGLLAYGLHALHAQPRARLFLQEAAYDLALSGEPQDAAQHLGAQSLGLRRLVLPRRGLPDRRLRLLRGLQGTGRRRRVGRGHGCGEERPRRDSRHASHASRRHGLSALHGPHGRTLLRRMHDGGR